MPSPETLVQPIVLLIDKDAPPAHLDAVKAAAAASVDALAEDSLGSAGPDIWDAWLSGPFTKTVRRANPKQWAKLPPACGEAAAGSARAVAYRPTAYGSLEKAIAKLQVSGTDLAPAGRETPEPVSPVLVLNRSLGMTTGKACAQAAHALMAYYLKLGSAERASWSTAGRPFSIMEADAEDFTSLAAYAAKGTLIRDNGLTEIAPGSATALVLTSRDDLP